MSLKIEVCGECGGKGEIPIRNAWKPDVVEYDICDVCGGDGMVDDDDFLEDIVPRTKKFDDYN